MLIKYLHFVLITHRREREREGGIACRRLNRRLLSVYINPVQTRDIALNSTNFVFFCFVCLNNSQLLQVMQVVSTYMYVCMCVAQLKYVLAIADDDDDDDESLGTWCCIYTFLKEYPKIKQKAKKKQFTKASRCLRRQK